jgi:nucleotide-binding universal stress UspA family protein
MHIQLHESTTSTHEPPHAGNGSPRTIVLEKPRLASPAENAIAHILVAVPLDKHEREAVLLALRMAAAQRARVTLLHVVAPSEPTSMHWLDAIDNLHRAMAGQTRHSTSAVEQGRSDLAAFLDREIPRELRDSLDLQVECRVGDVATEIARFTESQSVDLVFLCDRPSGWRPSILSSLSQRIVQLNSKPIVFARPQAKRNGNGA